MLRVVLKMCSCVFLLMMWPHEQMAHVEAFDAHAGHGRNPRT